LCFLVQNSTEPEFIDDESVLWGHGGYHATWTDTTKEIRSVLGFSFSWLRAAKAGIFVGIDFHSRIPANLLLSPSLRRLLSASRVSDAVYLFCK